jgi:hypothetical protein
MASSRSHLGSIHGITTDCSMKGPLWKLSRGVKI